MLHIKSDDPSKMNDSSKSHDISGIMKKKVVFVSGESSMSEVVVQMRDLNISSVLVIDHLLDVVGIITERDIVQKFTLLDVENKLRAKAFAVMTRPLVMARLDHLYEDIRNLFLKHKIRHYPVTHGGTKTHDIMGIVTVTDLAASWLSSRPHQESGIIHQQGQSVVILGVEAHKVIYFKLFKALSMEPIIDGDDDGLVRKALDGKMPALLDLDGLGVETIKRYLIAFKGHCQRVLLVSSDIKLVEPLKKVMNAEIFQVALKPLDISAVLRFLTSFDAQESQRP